MFRCLGLNVRFRASGVRFRLVDFPNQSGFCMEDSEFSPRDLMFES